MKKLLNKNTIFIILVIITVSGFLLFRPTVSATKNRNEYGTVIRQDLTQRITIAGIISPLKKTIITTPYNGYIKKLFVKVGDQVKLGDPIVSIAPSLQSGEDSFPLRAPFAGAVVQIEKTEGEFVKEGDPKEFILRIDDLTKLFVIANAPEIDRVKLKFGQTTVIKAAAILNRTYNGIIRELSLAAKEKDQWGRSQVVEFPIKIEITDSDEALKPGMSVVIDVITNKKTQALTLKHEFIHRDNEKYYVILSSGERKDIQVGIQNEDGFEIIAGLTEGDKIKQIDFSQLNSVE